VNDMPNICFTQCAGCVLLAFGRRGRRMAERQRLRWQLSLTSQDNGCLLGNLEAKRSEHSDDKTGCFRLGRRIASRLAMQRRRFLLENT
jgi:hypothetical protein